MQAIEERRLLAEEEPGLRPVEGESGHDTSIGLPK